MRRRPRVPTIERSHEPTSPATCFSRAVRSLAPGTDGGLCAALGAAASAGPCELSGRRPVPSKLSADSKTQRRNHALFVLEHLLTSKFNFYKCTSMHFLYISCRYSSYPVGFLGDLEEVCRLRSGRFSHGIRPKERPLGLQVWSVRRGGNFHWLAERFDSALIVRG